MTFSQFARSYLRLAEKENRSTFKTKQSVIDGKKEETPSLIEYFGNRLLVDIDLQAVQEYVFMLRSKGLADGTIVLRLSILKTILNRAEDLGHKIDARKIVKMKSFKLKKNKRIRVLKKAEAERLFAIADDFWKTLLSFSLNTGLRLSNVCGLKWEHVDFDEKMFMIPPSDMKNNDWLNIPMSHVVFAMLKRLHDSNGNHEFVFMRTNGSGKVPLSTRWIQREFSRLLGEAKIEDFRFHDLRHTCGQTMYNRGADLLTIKNCLGHRSIQSTMVYVHGNRERVEKAFNSLDKECWNAYATN
jgi:integrase